MFARYLEELNNFWALQGVSGAEIDKKDPVRKSGWGPLDGFEAMNRESAMREMAPEVSTQPLRGSLAEFSEDGAADGESRSSSLAPHNISAA